MIALPVYSNKVLIRSVLKLRLCSVLMIAPPGFEPGSPGPEPDILDHYTIGLYWILWKTFYKPYDYPIK